MVPNRGLSAPPPREHLAISGDFFDCHNWLGSTLSSSEWVETKGSSKHPKVPRTACNNELSGANFNSARLGNLGAKDGGFLTPIHKEQVVSSGPLSYVLSVSSQMTAAF